MCILGDLLFTPVIKDKMEHVKASAKAAPSHGIMMEFGVARGGSLGVIADAVAPRMVYGFDSFKGLPEAWVKSGEHTFPAGSFGLGQPIEPPRKNTELVIGMIEETLPRFLTEHMEPLAFLHIDVDLGNVTSVILSLCGSRFTLGTVLRFDEFCDWGGYESRYMEWPRHEYGALMAWLGTSGRRVRPLSRDSLEGASFMVMA